MRDTKIDPHPPPARQQSERPLNRGLASDMRRIPARPDLAALSLRGKVQAARYTPGVTRQVVRPVVPLRRRPEMGAGLDTEALYGELVTVFDEADGWAWGQLRRDQYVGYMPADVLSHDIKTATHRVRALGTFVYPVPDIKAPPLMLLSLNSSLAVADESNGFCQIERGGYVVSRHVTEGGRVERDYADVAERFIGTPYLWGGKSRLGIDCSGLVQISLEAAGIACPRDSDMQSAELGTAVTVPPDFEGLKRGDLVFWRGHVGMMADGIMLVHANAHHMAVVIEPLPEAAGRIAKQGSEITAIRRLPALTGAARKI